MQVAKPEASTFSKSVDATGAQRRNEIVNGKMGLFDKLFPLLNEIQKQTNIPDLLYNVMVIYVILQIFACSFWPALGIFKAPVTIWDKIIKYWIIATLFTDTSGSDTGLTIVFIIITIFAVIFIFGLVIQGIIFTKQRRFIKWTLYITRFVIEFCPTVCMCPMGVFIGMLFQQIVNNPRPLVIVYFVVTLVYLVIYLWDQSLQSRVFNINVYISSAPTASWNGNFHLIYLVGNSLFPLLSYVMTIFDVWIMFILIICKVLFDIFVVFLCTELPLVTFQINSLVAAVFTSMATMDIVFAIYVAGVSIRSYVMLIVLFGVFFISWIIWAQITNIIVRNVSKELSYDSLEGEEEQNNNSASPMISNALHEGPIRQHFMANKLDTSYRKCKLYLRVGIYHMSDMFLDWSLIKFIVEFHDSTDSLCTICQTLSFFPSESRMLNFFFCKLIDNTSLNFSQRFLVYQINALKGLRQSSASSEITDHILDMKNRSNDAISMAKEFWTCIPTNISTLYDIRKTTIQTYAMYKEFLDKWPNNIRMCEDCSNFLIEGASNFIDGLKIKFRADLIEQGKNFVVDLPFRAFVRHFPEYLKKNVMDVKGNFIKNNSAKSKNGGSKSINGSSSQSSNSTVTSGIMDGDLDAEIEESLGKASFSNHRLRLGFQRALQQRKSNNIKMLIFFGWCMILLTFICTSILFVFYFNLFDDRAENMQRQMLLNNFRFGFDTALTILSIYWMRKIRVLPDDLWTDMKNPSLISNNHNIYFANRSILEEANRWVDFARENLEKFQQDAIKLAVSGEDVLTMMSEIIDDKTPFIYCRNGNKTRANITTMLMSAATYMYLRLRALTMDNSTCDALDPNNRGANCDSGDMADWMHSKDACEIYTNAPDALTSFDRLAESISDAQITRVNTVTTMNYIMLGVFDSLYFILTEPFLFYYMYNALKELNGLLDIMRSIDDEVKAEAAKSMKSSNSSSNETFHQSTGKNSIRPWLLYLNIAIPFVFGAAIGSAIILLAEDHNQNFLYLEEWLFDGLMRSSYMHESFQYAMLVIAITHNYTAPTFVTFEDAKNQAEINLKNLIDTNNKLLRPTTGAPCIGQDTRLDQIHFGDNCEPGEPDGSFHDTYRCASLDRGISVFYTLVKDAITNPEVMIFDKGQFFYHAFHVSNDHLIDMTMEAAKILSTLADQRISDVRVQLMILCIGGIAVILVVFVFFFIQINQLTLTFEGAIQMMLRIPPHSITSNHLLFNFLMHKTNQEKKAMTVSKTIIHQAHDAVFFLNRTESIEEVNDAAVNDIFGYTPEQLLGQPFSTVIPEEKNPSLFENFNLMRTGQSSLEYQEDARAVSDNDEEIPVHVTILGISENNTHAKSFVVIVRDETATQERRQKAEAAKAQSEKLLYQILPRDIVSRINAGESEITFSVPHATIIFIDIQKFSEYARDLAPSQIMENLSLVFATFDSICAKYPLITKIKLIGDVYMAAAGLFQKEGEPKEHATEVVRFALDALAALEDVNAQLDASLQVRIGVNTDGPLIAGVLGTDKPVFDIIGDPINVAARLQSTDVAGCVQISQKTYDAIHDSNFIIEQRGLIELKGKGKQMAYLVRGCETGSFFSNNSLNE